MNKEQLLEPFKRPVFIITLILIFLLNMPYFFGKFLIMRIFSFVFWSGMIYLFYAIMGFESYDYGTKIYQKRWFVAILLSLLVFSLAYPILKFSDLNQLAFLAILFMNILNYLGVFLLIVLIYDLIKSKFNALIYFLTGISGLIALLSFAASLWTLTVHCFMTPDCENGLILFIIFFPIFLIFGTIFIITILKIKNKT